MLFRPLAARNVRWAPLDGEGLEHLHLTATPDGIAARSVVTKDVPPDAIVAGNPARVVKPRAVSTSPELCE